VHCACVLNVHQGPVEGSRKNLISQVKRYLPLSSLGIYVKRYLPRYLPFLFTIRVITHFGSNFLQIS